MACKDCLNGNCNGQVFSDKCVKYTGESNDLLGICSGDSLSYFEAAVVEQLEAIVTGKGITLSDLTSDCTDLITTIENTDKSLYSIIQVLIDKSCSLSQLVADINSVVGGSFNLSSSCIDLSGNLNLSQILQKLVTQICTNSTNITTISSDYVKASELTELVTAIINASTDSSSSVVQYNTRMVPYCAIPYHGSLSNFDSNGVGYSTLGFSNIYICDGSNGTPDYRGRSPMGANVNVTGLTMDSVTNPALNNNSAYAIAVNGKNGAFKDTLTVAQTPSHTHTITDPGHSHNVVSVVSRTSSGAFKQFVQQGTSLSYASDSNTTGIIINSTGGGSYHNTTHPVMGCNFIMYIPS